MAGRRGAEVASLCRHGATACRWRCRLLGSRFAATPAARGRAANVSSDARRAIFAAGECGCVVGRGAGGQPITCGCGRRRRRPCHVDWCGYRISWPARTRRGGGGVNKRGDGGRGAADRSALTVALLRWARWVGALQG